MGLGGLMPLPSSAAGAYYQLQDAPSGPPLSLLQHGPFEPAAGLRPLPFLRQFTCCAPPLFWATPGRSWASPGLATLLWPPSRRAARRVGAVLLPCTVHLLFILPPVLRTPQVTPPSTHVTPGWPWLFRWWFALHPSTPLAMCPPPSVLWTPHATAICFRLWLLHLTRVD
jgi:hypothetical protein